MTQWLNIWVNGFNNWVIRRKDDNLIGYVLVLRKVNDQSAFQMKKLLQSKLLLWNLCEHTPLEKPKWLRDFKRPNYFQRRNNFFILKNLPRRQFALQELHKNRCKCIDLTVIVNLNAEMPWGSIRVHILWVRPCFSSSVLHVWFV